METAENKGIVYEFGKFILDLQEKTLFVEVAGSPSGEGIWDVNLLIENNGKALTKEEMMLAIW